MGIDPLTAGIGAVGAIAGGLFGSKKTPDQTTTTAPWAAQQPFLRAGMQDAAGVYAAQRGTPYYTGDTYANLDPHTQAAMQGIYGYQGQGANNASTLTGAGADLTGYGAQGTRAAGTNLGNFNPQDPTQSNIRNAGLYANNPSLDGAIDAASRDVTRNLSEVQLPGIARGADANGNLNSSRTGIAEGIAMRGAQDQIGDISSQMRYDAYNSGLGLSEQARASNQGDYLNAQAQAGNIAGQAVGQGYNGVQTGQGLYYDNMAAQSAAGGLQQTDAQGNLTEAANLWANQQQRPWDLLNKYQGAITGAGSYPSTTQQGTGGGIGGALQGAFGGAAAGMGLYGSYRNLNQVQPTNNQNRGLY